MFNQSRTHFLFITRHPITNALSHLNTGCCPGMTVRELVTHWVRQHEILHEDLPQLKHSKVIRYEDFSRGAEHHLRVVHEWLGLPAEPLVVHVTDTSIDKYEREYCEGMQARGAVAQHKQLSKEFGERVRGFGYDLDAFACLQDILHLPPGHTALRPTRQRSPSSDD